MKKTKKTLLTAAILTAAVNFTSCSGGSGYDPATSEVQEVYGPPVVSETETTESPTETDPSTDEAVTTEEPYDPEKETFAAVYGPPPTD